MSNGWFHGEHKVGRKWPWWFIILFGKKQKSLSDKRDIVSEFQNGSSKKQRNIKYPELPNTTVSLPLTVSEPSGVSVENNTWHTIRYSLCSP